MAGKNRNPKRRKARKYRIALTEAQISRSIALCDKAIQDGDTTHTTESLRYNLNCVYVKILEEELEETKHCKDKEDRKMGSEPRSGSDSGSQFPPVTTEIDFVQVGPLVHSYK